jgi:signal transduction histidine kinase
LFLLAWANFLLIIPGWIIFALVMTSIYTAIVWIGLALWLATAWCLRVFSDANRHIAGAVLGQTIPASYKPYSGNGLFTRLRTVLTDSARWRDVAFLLVALSLGFAVSLTAVIAFIIFPIGYWFSPLLMRTYAVATRLLIGPSGEAALQQRIGQLETSRSATVDHSAAELRRIERDLHDGAQAQLVALGMNLGLAQEMVRRDPERAVALIAEARTSSSTALADLRSLVRGIHPPVLADRGLAGGLEALALATPMDVDVDIVLPGRPPAPVESAVYFAVAEALTNAAKHAAAGRIWIWVRYVEGPAVKSNTDGRTVESSTDGRTVGSSTDGMLTALVGDDGVGGAQLTAEGGLAGIERRLAAFDGTLSLASPLGGPTIVTLSVPCTLQPVAPPATAVTSPTNTPAGGV